MTTKAKTSGKHAWNWLENRCPRWGVLLVPEAVFPYGPQPSQKPLTVGEMESACGEGGFAAAKDYCDRHFDGMHLYATRSMPLIEERVLAGWDRDRADKYLVEYWMPRYGSDVCSYSVPSGEERPTDAVRMHYRNIA